MRSMGRGSAVEFYTNAKMTGNQGLQPRLGYTGTGRAAEDDFDRALYRKELS
jgi:hypothetical protein